MPIPFVTFKPAEYHKGKESYISFYVTDPTTQKLVRRKIKLNHIRLAKERERYANVLCHQINEKLFAGWNPLVEKAGAKAVTVDEAVHRFLMAKEKRLRPASMRSYRSFAGIFLQYMKKIGLEGKYCLMVEKSHLVSFMEWAADQGNLSNRTYNNYAGFLSTLFEFVVQRGYMAENPATNLPRLKVDRKSRTIIPASDRKRIMEYYQKTCPRFCHVMQLCFRLFIRPKEICMLQVGDVDLNRKILRVKATVSKNHNERELGIPDCLLDYFKTISDLPQAYYIFADRNTYEPGKKMMAPTRIAERWKMMRDELGFPEEYQFYSLKDTGITEMLEAGVPAKYVKELADHHSLRMTEMYTHKSDALKILEWNKLEF
ncbi:MAG: tyrosine-type recombinase/integrase [Bacteroidales bacterium]|nr:tyrosine-type recombinase/integrase [Bacteroidales bacterium]